MRDLKIYREKDVLDLNVLNGKTITFIGYGNQGRSQALNMRDHGIQVIVGNVADEYRERAKSDGFETFDISEAVSRADVIFILVPDELQSKIYSQSIEPYIKSNSTLVFAHGYNIAFKFIVPPKDIDVLIIAPRMIGIGVRECFLNGEGFFSFIGVEQDSSGEAKKKLLALTKGIGSLIKGAIESDFMEETVLDLFSEQGFAPALTSMLLKPIKLLVEYDLPEEAMLIEMILSGKIKFVFDTIRDFGVVRGISTMEARSQYGILSRTMRYDKLLQKISEKQIPILKHIENGGFSKEWAKKITKIKFNVIKFFSTRISFGRLETKLRKNLGIHEPDIWTETPYPTDEDIKLNTEIKQKLVDFERFSEF